MSGNYCVLSLLRGQELAAHRTHDFSLRSLVQLKAEAQGVVKRDQTLFEIASIVKVQTF